MNAMQQDFDALSAILSAVQSEAETFLDQAPSRPVMGPQNFPMNRQARLPEQGLGALAALDAYKTQIAPYLSGSAGPRYFGFVTGGTTPAALAGDWLTAVVDQNAVVPGDSIAPFIEVQALDYLADLFALPRPDFQGVLTTGATASNLVAMVVAREWCGEKLGIKIAQTGMVRNTDIAIFGGSPHASLIKVLGIAGFGQKKLQMIGRLAGREAVDPDALERALKESPATAKIVIASAGTVNSTDFDDLKRLAELCARYDAWLHVDAAFGIFARCSPKYQDLIAGLELADSITADGHKWLNVPYDCGIFFTRHIALLEQSFAMTAAYLETDSPLPSFMNRGVESSRRFRALPVWMTLMAYGRAGYRDMVERNCLFATGLAAWIEASPDYVLSEQPRLNVVLFRGRQSGSQEQQDSYNRGLIKKINAGGDVFLTPGSYKGSFIFRAAISNWRTATADLEKVTTALSAAVS